MDARIYLASQSPRRRELLDQIGVRFDPLLFRTPPRHDPEVDETRQGDESPETYVVRVACAKAQFAAQLIARRRLAPRPILAADTTLDIDGEVVGKPSNPLDATRILARLSARRHRVLTAIAVVHEARLEHRLSISEVDFRLLDSDEIRRYVQSGEPMDKAGAYGIQGRAAAFIEKVHGSYSGIMGLPLCETALLLRRFGYSL